MTDIFHTTNFRRQRRRENPFIAELRAAATPAAEIFTAKNPPLTELFADLTLMQLSNFRRNNSFACTIEGE
jgi:hypothetical protein